MTGSFATSSFNTSGRSSLAIQTPTSERTCNAARCACHTVSGTMTLPAGTANVSGVSPSASFTTVQSSLTTALSLMISRICIFSSLVLLLDRRCVHVVLEGCHADTTYGFDEFFRLDAFAYVDIQDAFDHGRHLVCRERWSDDLADRTFIALCATQRDLVPLRTVLVDAQDAYVADMVVS